MLVCRGRGRTFYAEATASFLNAMISHAAGGLSAARPTDSWGAIARSLYRVRSQSFFSWRLHLKSSLRASACPAASIQASRTAWHSTVLCDHPAKPSSSQSRPRPSGIAPEGSTEHHGLSKVRRDRGLAICRQSNGTAPIARSPKTNDSVDSANHALGKGHATGLRTARVARTARVPEPRAW